MKDLRDMNDAEAEAACLEALEALERRQPEAKMNRADELDSDGYYYYVRAGLEDVTQKKIEQAARGFRQASKDLHIPLDDFLGLVWVKRVSAAEYKRAGSNAVSESKFCSQGWYNKQDKKIRIDVNGTDILRTALHEAFHLYQDRQGRALGLSRQAEAEAEAYAQQASRPPTKEEEEKARLEAAYEAMYQRGEWITIGEWEKQKKGAA